ncbi:MAG: glycoside hydrolase family 16 protein [Anaerolineales bacterium]|nr:glycoside hydrolase family 16 protein [Anaerolineales bacterium]
MRFFSNRSSHGLLICTFAFFWSLAGCGQAAITPTQTPAPSSTATPAPPIPTPTLVNWDLIWSDEFDAPDGAGVDSGKWRLTDSPASANGELQYYTSRIENVYIENPTGGNGVLVIRAIKEKYETREYTSGSLNTRGKFDQLYGRFEALIKIPCGQGIWPAFWMLGSTGGWPQGGEIDIMENIGREPNIVHGTMHGPGYSGANGIGGAFALPEGRRFADDFHLFAVEWEPNVIRWYVDNTLYKTSTPADLPEGAEWVYDQPFYLILNVAVGGGWPGYPDDTTVFPQTMKVDYVRVYVRPGGGPTETPK